MKRGVILRKSNSENQITFEDIIDSDMELTGLLVAPLQDWFVPRGEKGGGRRIQIM